MSPSSTPSPSPYNFRTSWKPTSRFREHLSISVPTPSQLTEIPLEKSHFSPDSPPPHPPQTDSSSTMRNTFRTRSSDQERDLEAGTRTRGMNGNGHGVTSPGGRSTWGMGFRDRFTKFFFELRTNGGSRGEQEQDLIPIQPAYMAEWPPLNVEDKAKLASSSHQYLRHPVVCPCHNKGKEELRREKRRKWCLILILIIFILLLLSNLIFLNVRVVDLSSPHLTIPTTTTTSSSSTLLSASAQQCLSQYTLNAPSSPSTYPCSTCLPVLQSVPYAQLESTDSGDAQQVVNAIQFCGLKGIFDNSGSNAQTSFKQSGWLNDTRFCAWTGVSCDGTGKVSALQLTFPGVPNSLPNELGALTGLQNLQVIGNNALPGGSLPTSFTNLTSLSTLHLESTSLTALPENLFSSLNNIKTLALIDNAGMGGPLPSSLLSTSLTSLAINGQQVTNDPLTSISGSASLQSSLSILDLSSTSLSTPIPSTITALHTLSELHLDSANILPPLPANFPPNMQLLSMQNDTGLKGATLSGSVCTSTALKSCKVTGSQLTLGSGSGCGVCQ
ncbi:hypothetical protein JAAARDRAFT_36554 [Jaapia argillacea MUCL 33604]|uniref:Leucine-rich repeat-containing N-terminal plant-type domain-containing protein n=1 Tax=Jaapia argillacea MUCL 33604 TaxID=933084 RepID=A0A067Q1B8_9AGAM|nr:hypothetical protein JAAARDRAFT_36554 [Jaapia argillacea MUCL 33604]